MHGLNAAAYKERFGLARGTSLALLPAAAWYLHGYVFDFALVERKIKHERRKSTALPKAASRYLPIFCAPIFARSAKIGAP
jgi:hypothetical protein